MTTVRVSPFDRANSVNQGVVKQSVVTQEKPRSILDRTELTRSPVYAPATIAKEKPPVKLISKDEIDTIGVEAGKNLRNITSSILKIQRSSSSDEMTGKLNSLVLEAKNLNPTNMQGGFVKKLFTKVLRLKENMFAEFDTIEGRINTLTKDLEKELTVQKVSLKDITKLREANLEFGKAQDRDYQVYCNHLQQLQEHILTLESQEDIDSLQETVDNLEIRLADVKAMRVMTGQMEPKLKNMEKNVDSLIRTGNNLIEKVVPAYTMVFSQYLIAQGQRQAAEVQNNVINEYNAALILASDKSVENDEAIARLTNRQLLDIDTLKHDHENVLKSIENLSNIAKEAREGRIAYVEDLNLLEDGLAKVFKGNY